MTEIHRSFCFPLMAGSICRFMTSKPPSAPPAATPKPPCKHLRVQIVSRDEDAEFVECKECGEVFESSEFKDMNIEEQTREEL
jgi:hypothetical protein